jgi:hypothetical protein
MTPGLLGEDNDGTGMVGKAQCSIKKPIRDEDGHVSLLAHDRASTEGQSKRQPEPHVQRRPNRTRCPRSWTNPASPPKEPAGPLLAVPSRTRPSGSHRGSRAACSSHHSRSDGPTRPLTPSSSMQEHSPAAGRPPSGRSVGSSPVAGLPDRFGLALESSASGAVRSAPLGGGPREGRREPGQDRLTQPSSHSVSVSLLAQRE